MEKIYTAIPISSNIKPNNESIDKIKASAASYRLTETDQLITFEGFLN